MAEPITECEMSAAPSCFNLNYMFSDKCNFDGYYLINEISDH